MKLTLFRCGRCGNRYANPLTHTCVIRLDAKRPPRKTRFKPQASVVCGRCGKPYANPLTHVCRIKTDFRKRKKAHARQQAQQAKQTKQAKARQQSKQQARRKPASAAGGSRPRTPNASHDYRECFYASQPDRGRPTHDCERFPCRVYREGHQHGHHDGYLIGHAKGYTAGYNAGYANGYSAGYSAGLAAGRR